MFRAAFALLLAAVACAQNEIADAAKSPVTLARYIDAHASGFDWDALWTAIGGKDPGVVVPPCGNPIGACSTQIVTVLNPDQAILIIQSAAFAGNDIYLRYLQQANGSWRFAGERRAFVKEYPRRHEIVRVGGRPYLKIDSDHSQIGSGFTQEVEDWFDLTQPDFQPVLSFTANGTEDRFSQGVGRTIQAHALFTGIRGLEVDVILDVHFVGPGLDLEAMYTGIYVRPANGSEFALRGAYAGPRTAPIPAKDFESLAGVGTGEPSNGQLLVYAFPGLQKIAAGTDAYAKKWLRSVLDNAADTPERRELLQLLGN